MKLRHDIGGLGHGDDHIVSEILGMGGCKPHSFQTFNLAACTQQLREGLPVPKLHPIGVHVLPQKGDLLHTLVN